MSSYLDDVLVSGEEVKYVAHTSLWSLSQPLIGGACFLFGALFMLLGMQVTDWYLALVPALVGIVMLVSAWIRYMSTELVITSKRVVAKFGFISRRTIEISLLKIESIQVNQSIVGRMLNFGDLVISGASDSQAPIPGITAPLEFRRRFAEIHERALRRTSPA